MSAHISESLPRLLTGDATRDETLAAAEHLRGCPDCQDELVSAVVAHAALTSAHRFAPEIVAAELGEDEDQYSGEGTARPADHLPDMSAVFAQVRTDAVRPAGPGRQSGRRWLLAAAAAVVFAGGGIAAGELVGSGTAPHATATTVTLRPVGGLRSPATATVSGGTMRVDATALPKLGADRQYEVWLVATGGTQPRPVGYVGANRTATLPVPQPVMARYDSIAISIQKTDQVQFSGDMVALGHYA